jgi:hypothetical protein
MLTIQTEIFKYAFDLMQEAELVKGLKGKDKLTFVQNKLKEVIKNKTDWDNTTKEEAYFFIDTLLPGAIELTIKFSKLQFVKEVTTTCCGWMMK